VSCLRFTRINLFRFETLFSIAWTNSHQGRTGSAVKAQSDETRPWISTTQLAHRHERKARAGNPSAELIRRQLGNSFGDFFDFHVAQYSTAEAWLRDGKGIGPPFDRPPAR
jgi:hypothetical protein